MTESVSSFASLGRMFEEYRPRLSEMLVRRIDPSLAHRVDPDDVLNEAFITARMRWPNAATQIQSESPESTLSSVQYAWLLVRSPKTEHHQHHETRLLPLFESIETALTEHRDDLVQSGSYKEAGRVFEDIDAESNLRTRFECIIRKAKVQQWPKLWQNLRASAATDMAQIFPSFVATGFCGHTLEVAKEHYYMLTDTDLTAALNSGFGKIATPEKRST